MISKVRVKQTDHSLGLVGHRTRVSDLYGLCFILDLYGHCSILDLYGHCSLFYSRSRQEIERDHPNVATARDKSRYAQC